MRRVGATLHRGAQASHCRGLSCCGAQAPDAQAQYLWLTGPVAPWHVGSSQTRARTRVPCIGRQILNHCATREDLPLPFCTENSSHSSLFPPPIQYPQPPGPGIGCIPTWTPLPSHPAIPGHLSGKEENSNSKRYMHPNVHCSTIYNNQDMETT